MGKCTEKRREIQTRILPVRLVSTTSCWRTCLAWVRTAQRAWHLVFDAALKESNLLWSLVSAVEYPVRPTVKRFCLAMSLLAKELYSATLGSNTPISSSEKMHYRTV